MEIGTQAVTQRARLPGRAFSFRQSTRSGALLYVSRHRGCGFFIKTDRVSRLALKSKALTHDGSHIPPQADGARVVLSANGSRPCVTTTCRTLNEKWIELSSFHK